MAFDHAGAIGIHVMRLEHKMSSTDAAQLAQAIAAADPNVEYAEPDYVAQNQLTPNDPYYGATNGFGNQWNLFSATGGINMPSAWDLASGAGIIVAVLDTGYTKNPDLDSTFVGGYDFISDPDFSGGTARSADASDLGNWAYAGSCGNGQPSSETKSVWHGEHVAGIIGAVTNNSVGTAGVAYSSKIVMARVSGKCGAALSDIVDALTWAATNNTVPNVPANLHPARVVNMSLGMSGSCPASMQNAINAATARGVAVVVAAGNSSVNTSQFWPANCSGVIAVGATNLQGTLASYSNYGSSNTFCAPGGEQASFSAQIVSSYNAGISFPTTPDTGFLVGTSMAAPHVSGAIALLLSLPNSPSLTSVVAALKQTATPVSNCGAGLINVGNAAATLYTAPAHRKGGNPPNCSANPASCV
jgi:serine protease